MKALPLDFSPLRAKKSAPVEFEISPYKRELDDVFPACGDVSAYAAPAATTTSSATSAAATAAA